MLARYKLCYGPVFVRPSVWLGAEGPRDAKSCRETRVATSSLTRPIATGAQQWRGRSIHAAYCYRRAAVARLVHPRGLLLLGLWSNNRVANVQALPCFSSFITARCYASAVLAMALCPSVRLSVRPSVRHKSVFY